MSNRYFATFAFVLITTTSAAWALFASPEAVPVERLLANATAYVTENPKDPQGYYVLGRIHSMALAFKRTVVGAYPPREEESKLPRVAPDFLQKHLRSDPQNPPREPNTQELVLHAGGSVENYTKALAIDSAPPHYHLGLAYSLELGSPYAAQVTLLPRYVRSSATIQEPAEQILLDWISGLGVESADIRKDSFIKLVDNLYWAAPLLHERRAHENIQLRMGVSELLSRHWIEQAIHAYLWAYNKAIDTDLQVKERPIAGLNSLVSYEAGKSYVRLVRQRGIRESERDRVERIEKSLQKLDNLPRGAITPIIFNLHAPLELIDLLAPDKQVTFDLDGDLRAEKWPWVHPHTAILVWDPDRTGRITSGRQLFGSVTWWLLPGDGYRALDLLDDDRDGRLRGTELKGIALWHDLNSNGVSDADEVTPIEQSPIESLATRATSTEGESPANRQGLRLRDGRTLPTYDWAVRRQ